jgi:hypothetical protein
VDKITTILERQQGTGGDFGFLSNWSSGADVLGLWNTFWNVTTGKEANGQRF